MNEAETRAEHIDTALKAAGWGVVEGSKVLREYPMNKPPAATAKPYAHPCSRRPWPGKLFSFASSRPCCSSRRRRCRLLDLVKWGEQRPLPPVHLRSLPIVPPLG